MVATPSPVVVDATALAPARQMLSYAVERLDADDTIGAGVRIREAARLFLIALAERADIKRPLHKFPRPARIARALCGAGRIDCATLEALLDLNAACNATAHCELVDAAVLREAATRLGGIFDSFDDATQPG